MRILSLTGYPGCTVQDERLAGPEVSPKGRGILARASERGTTES